jgi:hypothetical protein
VQGSGDKPKRARTAYLIFCDRYRNQIMKEVHWDPTSKFTREEMQRVTTRQGLSLVHSSAQPELLLTQTTPQTPPHTPTFHLNTPKQPLNATPT